MQSPGEKSAGRSKILSSIFGEVYILKLGLTRYTILLIFMIFPYKFIVNKSVFSQWELTILLNNSPYALVDLIT